MATKSYEPSAIKSKEDRNKGRSGFLTLKKTNDYFVGYALFVADPEREDNNGYYEYWEHYTPATGYCACAGENCPLCEDGDNPSTRAKTLWLVVDEEDTDPAKGAIKVFNLNYYVIQEFAEDGGEALGRLYRVKKLEGNGKFSIRPKDGKLTKTQLKAALKDYDENHLRNLTKKQMNKVLAELGVEAAMNEDENENEDEPAANGATARKGTAAKSTAKAKDEPEAQEFDPDESDDFEELVVTVTKVLKSKNVLTVEVGEASFDIYGTDESDLTGYTKGDKLKVDAVKDTDGDFVVSAVEETEAEPEPESGEAATASADMDEVECEVIEIKSADETLVVKDADDNEIELYFLGEGEDNNGKDWSDIDLDDYKVGSKVKITAHIDDDGDMLCDTFPEIVGKTGGKKAPAKKTGGRK